jgi:hypothetical protein
MRQNSEGQNHRQQDYHLVPYFLVKPPMPGLWGPPPIRRLESSSARLSFGSLLPSQATNAGPWGPLPMMYPPYPPWAGWYGPWAPPSMPFHPGWSGPIKGFGYGGYYVGDGRYRHVSHQQDSKILRHENRMIQNPKLDGPNS